MHEDAIRPMEPHDLGRVLDWRNDAAVRAAMFSGQVIDIAEHRRWFEQASADPRRHLLVFEADGVPSGFVQFRDAGDGEVTWGFYAAPGAPRGTGRRLGTTALQYAFAVLGVRVVLARVRSDNAASLGFHRALGFVESGRLPAAPGEGPAGQDVVHFRLPAHAWTPVS